MPVLDSSKELVHRGIQALACLGAVALALLSCSRAERPSVLIVTIDTLRSDRLGCYGAPHMKTPGFDRIASEGVLFADCSSPIPETSPAHVSILSGLYPKNHGNRQNGTPVDSAVPLLPELFRERGYVTAGFVSGFPLAAKFGLARGFDHYDDYLVDGFTTRGGNVQGTERGGEKTVDSFLFWLRKVEDPFLAWVHLFDPHSVYAAPGPYRRMFYSGEERSPANRSMDGIDLPGYLMLSGITDVQYPVALYEGEVAYTDQQLRRLLDGLMEKGILDETLVVVVADHGESLIEHAYYFGHSHFLYQQSINVPLLLRWPGVLPRGEIVLEPASILDLSGTICEMLDIDRAIPTDGRSLLPLIHGASRKVEPLFLERSALAGPGMAAVRMGEWKYVRSDERGEELYNLESDPGEESNECTADPDRAVKFRSLLDRWRADSHAPPAVLDEETREVLRSLGYIN